jgi:hypothetical protein
MTWQFLHRTKVRHQQSEDRRFRTPKIPIADALETPSGSTEGNIKTIGDGSKVFFREHQFSLAIDENKSILRNKKRARSPRVLLSVSAKNSAAEKMHAHHFCP